MWIRESRTLCGTSTRSSEFGPTLLVRGSLVRVGRSRTGPQVMVSWNNEAALELLKRAFAFILFMALTHPDCGEDDGLGPRLN